MEEKDKMNTSQTTAEEEKGRTAACGVSEEAAGQTAGKEAAAEKEAAKEEKGAKEERKEAPENGQPKAETAPKETKGNGVQEGDSADTASETETAEEGAGNKKLDAKDQKIEELTDRYKRLFAEFDNYRKRTDAEKSGMYAEGQRSILEKILPILDNFERASLNVPEELKDSAYVAGVEKVSRAAMDTLKALGVEPIEALGQSFDANLHNAVMHVEDEEHGENEIVEEFQKGYKYKDKVLRYSMVKVAN